VYIRYIREPFGSWKKNKKSRQVSFGDRRVLAASASRGGGAHMIVNRLHAVAVRLCRSLHWVWRAKAKGCAALLSIALIAATSSASARALGDVWAGEILYFVLIDRFADGDPTNNARVQRRNPGGYHGGDLKGLTQQLDELADLGVTALWINPVQLQMDRGMPAQAPPALRLPEFNHWGFHGYWIADFGKMEPQFGSVEDLKNLVDAARKRGIKVLLDVVYNHTGYQSIYADRRTTAGEPWIRPGEGNCEVDPVTCRVGGLPDLRTELPEVRDYLLNANIALARQAGVAGFRLDTYKHLASEFWREHRARTREQLGPDFFLLAEYWGGTAQSLDGFFARDEVDSGFDFSFKGSCEAWVLGRGRSVAFGSYLRSRHQVRPGYVLAHYLSSHDEPMALGNLDGDKQKFRLCVAVQMTSLGMPVIYYGEEVGRGGTEWPLNRNPMPWGERDVMPGKGLARDEALRDFYKKLIQIRKQHPALTRGDYALLSGRDDPALAYGRRDAASGDQVLVLVNRDDKPLNIDVALPTGWSTGPLADQLLGGTVAPVDGRVRLELAPKSVRILAAPTTGAAR
jgi:alpha-amylase